MLEIKSDFAQQSTHGALLVETLRMKASALSIDISPQSPVALGAAGKERLPWLGIAEPIEANLLALWPEGDEAPLLLISLDLLYPGRILRSVAEAAAAPLDPARVFLAASHTHRAPMTDDTKANLGSPDPDYMSWLSHELTTAVELVLQKERFVSVYVRVGETRAAHSVNRRLRKRFFLSRRPKINSFVHAPNVHGATDETLLSITVEDANRQVIGVVWNYACHPVGSPIQNAVAAHYPRFVRQRVRHEFEQQLPVLFFQGFSGNTRPSATAEGHSFVYKLRRALSGPLFEDMTPSSYTTWSNSLADVVMESLRQQQPIDQVTIRAARIELDGAGFARPLKGGVTFHGLRVGSELSIVAASAEIMAEYAPTVREMSGSRFTLCVGCIDHTFGYAPTKQILIEGGYEAGEYCQPFGLDAINPDMESNLLDGFRAITKLID